jgi:hypothetical protein
MYDDWSRLKLCTQKNSKKIPKNSKKIPKKKQTTEVKEVFFFCRLERLSFIYLILHDNWTNDTHSHTFIIMTIYVSECVCVYMEWKYDSMQKVSLVHTMECQLWCGRNKVINLSTWKGKKIYVFYYYPIGNDIELSYIYILF